MQMDEAFIFPSYTGYRLIQDFSNQSCQNYKEGPSKLLHVLENIPTYGRYLTAYTVQLHGWLSALSIDQERITIIYVGGVYLIKFKTWISGLCLFSQFPSVHSIKSKWF